MQFLARLAALAVAAAPFLAQGAPFKQSEVVKGKYIIQLKPDVDIATLAEHHNKVREIHRRNALARRDLAAVELKGVEKEFGFGDFHGYSGGFDEATIEELRKLPEVLNIEEDTIMTTLEIKTQANSPWGLASISSKSGTGTDYLYDETAGAGTYVYVVDTGVWTTHQEFGGRVEWGFNAVNDVNTDNAGHGTHVAGIVGGATFGVAKRATIVAVKIFEGNSGTTSTVIKGFEWAVNDIVAKNRTSIAVINMSLGGAGSTTWDNAITAAWNQGVLAVVAAGNENQPASSRSPARSPEAICVGNVQQDLKRYGGSTGSNYGPAVDIFAAGTGIISAYRGSDNATWTLTGTSMAAPHVAGLVSYLRGLEGPMTGEAVKARLYELAVVGKVTDLRESADRLAFNGVEVPGES
ncbi:subtilisin-like protease-like protein [Westerdykella ornata]|uniref:Subtilisin-like protease-like protein n=1 Tax=Westerdykella ornata TaxID=318751 RepID=A0A6A6JFC9_WESOR|nr:subtilisin-like protease-like protein [Westerdykella ornata]KAF2275330.1 subtilisin-like protease-like protein [Westerdykella ornata]